MSEEKPNRNFDLASYKKSTEQMIATNDNSYASSYNRWDYFRKRRLNYTEEEIAKIIESGSIAEQQKLSRTFFNINGFYRQIVIHYATLLKYVGILIPNPKMGASLSKPHIQKKYFAAVEYLDTMNLQAFLAECALTSLIDGCYYGIVTQSDKHKYSVMKLPSGYCRSRFKDELGNDLIEFDVTYFNTIADELIRKQVLKIYPKKVQSAYAKFVIGKLTSPWVVLDSEGSICFPFFDGAPFFLSIIPETIKYDKALETNRERDLEEIKKVIVQKIPHLTDGRLLFEPEEAQEMHAGAVNMMKNEKNVSVLTTYADVDAIVSKTTNDNANMTIESMLNNIYSQAGVSSQLFSSTGSTTLDSSIKADLSMMMVLANKMSNFVTNVINTNFSNSNITFRYRILPVTYFNEEKYVDLCFKLASSGYSFLLPSIAMGLGQQELTNLKDLENDVLKLSEKLLPLSSSYTQSGDTTGKVGAPKKEQEDKAQQTIANEESLDNQTQ